MTYDSIANLTVRATHICWRWQIVPVWLTMTIKLIVLTTERIGLSVEVIGLRVELIVLSKELILTIMVLALAELTRGYKAT